MLTLSHFLVLRLRIVFSCLCLAGLPWLGAQTPTADEQSTEAGSGSIASAADEWPSLVIGFIGQSRYQPQTVAALAGAMDAARELGPQHRMHVTVVHRSPQTATASAQNEALRELFVDDTAGVLINPVDAAASSPLLALLNRQRMPVVTLGTTAVVEGISAAVVDDEDAIGEALAAEAFRLLDARSLRRGGGIALLAGPKGVEPYALRARAALRQLQRSPFYAAYGDYYCEPNMSAALQTLQAVTAQERDERLNVWISVGGWPLLGYHTDLPEANGLEGFIVADGLPQMLPHLERGRVRALVSPDYYGLGYAAMRQVLLAQEARRDASEGVRAENSIPAAEVISPTAAAQPATIPPDTTAQSATIPPTEAISANTMISPDTAAQPAQVVRVQVLPRIIRPDNLKAYAEQWASWLAQPM